MFNMITMHRTATTILLILSCSLLCCNRHSGIQYNMNDDNSPGTKGGRSFFSKFFHRKKGLPYEQEDALGRSPFIQAAANNDVDTMIELGESLLIIDSKDPGGRTALSWAAGEGQLAAVKYLVENGADMESIYCQQTPLLWAINNNHLRVVEFLVESGANLKVRDGDGATPLIVAAKRGNLEIVELLANKGADVNAKDNFESSVIHMAMCGRYLRMVAFLKDRINNIDEALTEAKAAGNSSVVSVLEGLPIANYECPICTNKFADSPGYKCSQCGNLTCLSCCEPIIRSINSSCPTCRNSSW